MNFAFERPTFLALGFALMASATTAQAQQSYFDDMNGLWMVKLGGQNQQDVAMTESYFPGGSAITLRFKDKVVQLTKSGNKLTSGAGGMTGGLNGEESTAEVDLTLTGFENNETFPPKITDDVITGRFYGQEIQLKRDLRSKAPVVVRLPGDRPWVRFMREILIPETARDRETYHTFQTGPASKFLKSCQLYVSGYWMGKYLNGGYGPQGKTSFQNIINGMNNMRISPRSISTSRFGSILRAQMAPDKMDVYALAKSGLGMYFSTAAGGAVRIPVTTNEDSYIWYITDRRANSKNGLVVMLTPTHPPLASSFGKWLLDLSESGREDDEHIARCVLEIMCKSDCSAANKMTSGNGRSGTTDYLGVMAIEDQRGVMFGNDGLSWGYNMTSGMFTSLIARALSHGQMRKTPDLYSIIRNDPGKWERFKSGVRAGQDPEAKLRALARDMKLDGQREELDIKVIVESWGSSGAELRRGECSYFDTLNGADDVLTGAGTRGGDDFQEGQGMATLRKLANDFMTKKYPAKVKALEDALAPFMTRQEAGYRAQTDVLHYMVTVFFNNAKFSQCTPAQATAIVNAGQDYLMTIRDDSREFEKFILENGVTKSDAWAPRASGF